MARARNLKPGFFKNELLAECQYAARILFEGLWTLADREGRLEDRPRRIRSEVLPYDNVNVDKLLNELADKKDPDGKPAFIVRYNDSGAGYIAVVNFKKHNSPHVKEPPSVIPAPYLPGQSPGLSGAGFPSSPFPLPESSLLNAESLVPGSGTSPVVDGLAAAINQVEGSGGSAGQGDGKAAKKVPMPAEAYTEVVQKGGNSTVIPSYSHEVVGWAAMKLGGSVKIAQAQERDAAYLREAYIAEYERLCESMSLRYGGD